MFSLLLEDLNLSILIIHVSYYIVDFVIYFDTLWAFHIISLMNLICVILDCLFEIELKGMDQ